MRSGLHNIGEGFISGKAATLHTVEQGFVRALDTGGAAVVAVVDDLFLSSTSDATEYTFSDVALVGTWTHLILMPGNRRVGGTTVSSLTVQGTAATASTASVTDGSQTAQVLAVEEGTATPDIVVTWGAACENMGLGVIAVTGMNSVTATATDTDANNDPLTGSVVVDDGGIVAANVFASATGGTAWTGLTEFYDSNIESVFEASGAYATFAAGQTVNVSANIPNNREALAIAAYR